MNSLKDKLKENFGFSSFKNLQEPIINNLLEGNNSFVIMPTGGGKSLCYQLPAIILDGTALVISPLIALMKNQVDLIRSNNIKIDPLNDKVKTWIREARVEQMRNVKFRKEEIYWLLNKKNEFSLEENKVILAVDSTCKLLNMSSDDIPSLEIFTGKKKYEYKFNFPTSVQKKEAYTRALRLRVDENFFDNSITNDKFSLFP